MRKETNFAEKFTKGSKGSLVAFVALGFLLPSLACRVNSDELELARLKATTTSIEATSQIIELTRLPAEITAESQKSEAVSPTAVQEGEAIDQSLAEPADSAGSAEDLDIVVPPLPPPAPTPEGILFFEDFSNNTNGWDLSKKSGSVTRLSQGQMLVTVQKQSSIWMIIPEFEVDEEFYAEAQITYREGQSSFTLMGWGVGNSNGNNHKFLAGYDSYAYYDNNLRLFSTSDSRLFSPNNPVVIGLEFINGDAILYVSGEQKDIFPIQPYGKNIGVVLWNTNPHVGNRDSTITIDNIIVRESR